MLTLWKHPPWLSNVKQVHELGGDVSGLVPPAIHRALMKKLPQRG